MANKTIAKFSIEECSIRLTPKEGVLLEDFIKDFEAISMYIVSALKEKGIRPIVDVNSEEGIIDILIPSRDTPILIDKYPYAAEKSKIYESGKWVVNPNYLRDCILINLTVDALIKA